MPAGVSCLCPYDKMLPIGPVNLTHTHTGNARMFRRFVGLLTRDVGQRYLSGDSHLNID